MTDGLRHLEVGLELGRQLGRGEKLRLTKDCPTCKAHPQDCPNNVEFGGTCDNGKVGGDAGERPWEEEDCPVCDGEGRCPDCQGTGRVPA